MRVHEIAIVTVFAVVALTAFVLRFAVSPDDCSAASARSVVSLFAPCLQREAMNDPAADPSR
jgi:hypothetical protein